MINYTDLRNWQKKAIEEWKANNEKGIIQAVPGAGKTWLGLFLFQEARKKNPNLKLLIVCPRLTLTEQWIDEISKQLDLSKEDIFRVDSGNVTKAYEEAPYYFHQCTAFTVLFTQIEKLLEDKSWQKFDWFLIVDELHNTRSTSKDNQTKTWYSFPNEFKHTLGLSATPNKKQNVQYLNLGKIIYRYTLKEALKDKVILQPKLIWVPFDPSPEAKKKISELKGNSNNEKFIEAQQNIVEEDFENKITRVIDDPIGFQLLVKKIFDFEGEKFLLIFLGRIQKADELESILKKHQNFENVVQAYHSQTDGYSKHGNFEKIKIKASAGELKILVVVETISEGIDFPYANYAIMAKISLDPSMFIQKVGRVLRIYENPITKIKQKMATIYYYSPRELIEKMLGKQSDENYFKELIKICDEEDSLYVLDINTGNEKAISLEQFQEKMTNTQEYQNSNQAGYIEILCRKLELEYQNDKQAAEQHKQNISMYFEQLKKNLENIEQLLFTKKNSIKNCIKQTFPREAKQQWGKINTNPNDIQIIIDGAPNFEINFDIWNSYQREILGKLDYTIKFIQETKERTQLNPRITNPTTLFKRQCKTLYYAIYAHESLGLKAIKDTLKSIHFNSPGLERYKNAKWEQQNKQQETREKNVLKNFDENSEEGKIIRKQKILQLVDELLRLEHRMSKQNFKSRIEAMSIRFKIQPKATQEEVTQEVARRKKSIRIF